MLFKCLFFTCPVICVIFLNWIDHYFVPFNLLLYGKSEKFDYCENKKINGPKTLLFCTGERTTTSLTVLERSPYKLLDVFFGISRVYRKLNC